MGRPEPDKYRFFGWQEVGKLNPSVLREVTNSDMREWAIGGNRIDRQVRSRTRVESLLRIRVFTYTAGGGASGHRIDRQVRGRDRVESWLRIRTISSTAANKQEHSRHHN